MNPLLAARTLPHPLFAYTYPLPLMPDATPPPAPPAAAPATTAASPPPDKGYACQWESCDKTLPDPELLYIHLCNDHIGRKSTNNLCLTCKWKGCGATCAKRDHITSHLRVHTPLKPHVCEICSKPFKRPQDLKKHEKIHTEEHHMAHRHSKAITVHDESYVERVRAQAPNAAPPRGLDLNSLHPSLAGLGLGAGHNLAYLAGATATREHARSPTLASFAGAQHHNAYGPGIGEFGSVSPRSADEALTPASARISPMPPHADINYNWDTLRSASAAAVEARATHPVPLMTFGPTPRSAGFSLRTTLVSCRHHFIRAITHSFLEMAERLSTLSSLGFPPLGAAHPSLSLHPNANSPPSAAPGAVPPSLPIPDPRSAEELAQWNQYLVKLGEQVASSFGLAGMPGLLGFGLGLSGLPGLGMLGAAAGGLGGVDYNAIAAYQQAQAQALAVQSQIAAGLYPGLDLASLAAAAQPTPRPTRTLQPMPTLNTFPLPLVAPLAHRAAEARLPRSPSLSSMLFDHLVLPSLPRYPWPRWAPWVRCGRYTRNGNGRQAKRRASQIRSSRARQGRRRGCRDGRRRDQPAASSRRASRTPTGYAHTRDACQDSCFYRRQLGALPFTPCFAVFDRLEWDRERIKLPGIQSLLEPSFRLRPVASSSSPASSSENEDDDSDSNSTATSRAGSPSAQGGTVLPSFASIALNDSRPANKEVEERMRHIAVIQAMIVAVNREWVAKHGASAQPQVEERKLEVSRDVEMVA
ncbi:Transcription factor [Rhizoctonia solani]|uniref:Transcription factor n=1 Tax=Rhizoctonia solani TaxID=456999 RepID=A0A8H7IEV8_9AGAM|nr:Transcription factor [Rhizoctonia solani]